LGNAGFRGLWEICLLFYCPTAKNTCILNAIISKHSLTFTQKWVTDGTTECVRKNLTLISFVSTRLHFYFKYNNLMTSKIVLTTLHTCYAIRCHLFL
jgi:hypothetical protein